MLEEISEEVTVGVLAELVENKPVTKIAVVKDSSAGGEVGVSETSASQVQKEVSEHISIGIFGVFHCFGCCCKKQKYFLKKKSCPNLSIF